MPIYDYDCAACGRRFEVMHGVHAEGPTTCVLCGKGPVRKAVTAAAVHYRGSGWAKKERRSAAASKSSKDDSSSNGAGSDGGSSDGTSADHGGGDTPSSGDKPPAEGEKPAKRSDTPAGVTDTPRKRAADTATPASTKRND